MIEVVSVYHSRGWWGRTRSQLRKQVAPYRDLTRFTDFAVQIRYDDQPELQNLDRASWNDRADALVTAIEALLPPPVSP
jgi:hypothetical protein